MSQAEPWAPSSPRHVQGVPPHPHSAPQAAGTSHHPEASQGHTRECLPHATAPEPLESRQRMPRAMGPTTATPSLGPHRHSPPPPDLAKTLARGRISPVPPSARPPGAEVSPGCPLPPRGHRETVPTAGLSLHRDVGAPASVTPKAASSTPCLAVRFSPSHGGLGGVQVQAPDSHALRRSAPRRRATGWGTRGWGLPGGSPQFFHTQVPPGKRHPRGQGARPARTRAHTLSLPASQSLGPHTLGRAWRRQSARKPSP